MELKEQLLLLANGIEAKQSFMTTEEATKNALIVPFINALGYNVFDPREVRPELTPDRKNHIKDARIDYSIFREDSEKPIIIIECKQWNKNLDGKFTEQLKDYYAATRSRFGILTNGIKYMFFTDLEEKNIMDDVPFFEFDLNAELTDLVIDKIKLFHKSKFNEEEICASAAELKYLKMLQNALKKELDDPSEKFVKLMLDDISFQKMKSSAIVDKFKVLLKKASKNYINEILNTRLKNAMQEETSTESLPEGVVFKSDDGRVVTTEEEQQAYEIIKAICAVRIDNIARIQMKDTQSYCIIYFDKQTQPICRLYFNKSNKKEIALFNEVACHTNTRRDSQGKEFFYKKENKYDINSSEEIYKYAKEIIDVVEIYEKINSGEIILPKLNMTDTANQEE